MSPKAVHRAFGFRVGQVAGIDIHVDLSLAIAFALITFSLGTGLFPSWHPDWGPFVTWATALAAAFLFFVSILIHELSHALVGRAHGIPVNAVTLFVFGGVAQLEREPHAWRAEMLGLRVPLLGTGLFPGMWLALIGWFLNNAALMSYRQLLVSEALQEVPVWRLMRRDVLTVRPDMRVDAFVDERLMRDEQRGFPVVENGELLGLVCLEDIRGVPRREWHSTSVCDVMTPAERLLTVTLHADAAEALQCLSRGGVNQLPVIDDGALAGLIRREDILRWLSLYGRDARE